MGSNAIAWAAHILRQIGLENLIVRGLKLILIHHLSIINAPNAEILSGLIHALLTRLTVLSLFCCLLSSITRNECLAKSYIINYHIYKYTYECYIIWDVISYVV